MLTPWWLLNQADIPLTMNNITERIKPTTFSNSKYFRGSRLLSSLCHAIIPCHVVWQRGSNCSAVTCKKVNWFQNYNICTRDTEGNPDFSNLSATHCSLSNKVGSSNLLIFQASFLFLEWLENSGFPICTCRLFEQRGLLKFYSSESLHTFLNLLFSVIFELPHCKG